MKKKIVGICICTLVFAITLLPVAESQTTYQDGESTAKIALVCCCALRNTDITITQTLTQGRNWVWGKDVVINGSLLCVGVAALKKTNSFGYMHLTGAPFNGKLHIGKFWGAIIIPDINNATYILTGIGANIQYIGDTPPLP